MVFIRCKISCKGERKSSHNFAMVLDSRNKMMSGNYKWLCGRVWRAVEESRGGLEYKENPTFLANQGHIGHLTGLWENCLQGNANI